MKKKATENAPSFLTKLSTLRDFVKGMGVKASEDDLSNALKNGGYSVDLALERILTGNFGGGSIGGSSNGGAMATTNVRSTPSSTLKKRGSAELSKSSSKTPKSSGKRQKYHGSATTPSNNNRSGSSARIIAQHTPTPSGRLLLCKRWTVACSKSTRGLVNYGEALDFSENWKNALGRSSPSNGKKKAVVDPMVRFHSQSGNVEGTLDRYLCSIIAPLLRLPAADASDGDEKFTPLVAIEGEALMEDRALVIGSDIPVSLEVYLNNPLEFFDLFQCRRGAGEMSSKLFFQKNVTKHKRRSRMLSHQGKKVKSDFTGEDLAEVAFRLLQWAEMGEEIPLFERKAAKKSKLGCDDEEEGKKPVVDDEKGSTSFSWNDDANHEDDEDEDENSEESLPSEEMNELNQLVVSTDDPGEMSKEMPHSHPELSDPEGFKPGVALRPYQRQALHWMCCREGHCDAEGGGEGDGADSELDLLVELAAGATAATSDASDSSVQVWGGGKTGIGCDCGPVVVSDTSVASSAAPVVDYLQIEKDETGTAVASSHTVFHHPLWKKRYLATGDLSSVYAFYVNELLGIASASPPNPPKKCIGGILADAMGLGKTVMLLSLILKVKEEFSGREKITDGASSLELKGTAKRKCTASSKDHVDDLLPDVESESSGQNTNDDEKSWSEEQDARRINNPSWNDCSSSKRTTLVIAPLSLISQWEEELATKTNLSHLVYYDSAKKGTSSDAFSCIDVVVTTYGTMQSEYVSLTRSNTNGSGTVEQRPDHNHPLLNFQWKRIILDEAHSIKNPATVLSKACCMLQAETRWCVTGTPIQNSLRDVYGLLKFLRHEPWCEAVFWKKAIDDVLSPEGTASAKVGNTSEKEEEEALSQELRASAAIGRVRSVLAPIILRRTKDTLTEDGTPILTLPPIDLSIVHVTLSPAERDFYNALLERSQSVFEGFINAGTASKSWFAIFSLLQRLRQSCDHVSLTVAVNEKLDSTSNGEVGYYRKDRNEVSGDEPFPSCHGEDTVDDSFLNNLIRKFKFKKKINNAVSDMQQEELATPFAKQVAESLSQCVQSKTRYLQSECPICLDEPRVEDAVHTPCAHMFCRDCLLSEFQQQLVRSNKTVKKEGTSNEMKVEGGLCPVCNDYVKSSTIIQIKKSEKGELISKYLNLSPSEEKENTPNASTEALPRRDVVARETLKSALNGAGSSKLDAVLAELDRVWTSDPGSKVLVFSQYLGFLDIVGRALENIGVACFRIDGKMSLKERVAMIGKFNKKKSKRATAFQEEGVCLRGSVFLVSMKAGGVGLNLVAASSVFIIDPWWNQAIEDQCINRIHRIGQQAKVVRVRKFLVTDSVEEKIANLQGRKKGMANQILSDGDSGGQLDSAKPTLEDFKLLFGR